MPFSQWTALTRTGTPHIPSSEDEGRSPPGSASRRDKHLWDQLLVIIWQRSPTKGDRLPYSTTKRRGTISAEFCRHTPPTQERGEQPSGCSKPLSRARSQRSSSRSAAHRPDLQDMTAIAPEGGSAAMPQGQGGERRSPPRSAAPDTKERRATLAGALNLSSVPGYSMV